jgi:hypothetical protein
VGSPAVIPCPTHVLGSSHTGLYAQEDGDRIVIRFANDTILPFYPRFGAGIALSENRITTDCTVRGSNPGGGEIFRTCPGRPWGPFSFLSNEYQISFPGVKRPWSGVDHLPPSCAEAKERVQLHSTPLLGLHGQLYGELHLLPFLPFFFGWQGDQVHGRRNDDVMFRISDITMTSCLRLPIQYDGYSARSVWSEKHRHRCTILATEGEMSRSYLPC